MKQDWVAYLLAACSVFGFAGLHRFYLNRPVSGLFYLATWGLFGLGTLHDLIRMRSLVTEENRKLLGGQRAVHVHIHGTPAAGAIERATMEGVALLDAVPPEPSPVQRGADREYAILKCAKDHGGTVTAPLVALEAKISLRDAQKELHRLREAGFCSIDVGEDGAELFTFQGLSSTRPVA